MGESKSSLKNSLHASNKLLKAQRNPYTACSDKTSKSGQSLKSASGDGSITKSWKAFYSTLFHHGGQNRKLAEQGLVAPKKIGRLEKRQIQDKSYYKGIIYKKGYEISSEMKKLLKEIDMMMADQSTYINYKIKAQAQASELKNLQASFAEYNLAIDFCNTEIEAGQVQNECERLKEINQMEIVELEKLFELRKKKEALVAELETEIRHEGYFSDILSSTAHLEFCERYQSLKKLDNNLRLVHMKLNEEFKLENSVKKSLEERCVELNRNEALELLSKFYEDKNKRDAILNEQAFQGAVSEEEYLSRRKEEDKELLTCIMRETRVTQTEIEKLNCDFKTKNNDMQEERASKLSTLHNRDSVIDSHISSFAQKQAELLEKRSELQVTIIRLLEKMSGQLSFDVVGGKNNTRSISISCEDENTTLKQQMKDLLEEESLVDKLLEEATNLKLRIVKNNEEILFYSDVGKLKRDKAEEIEKLLTDARNLQKQKNAHGMIVRDLQTYRDILIEKLNKSDLFEELSNMEKQWRLLEQENFSIQEQLAEAKSQGDYSSVKVRVMKKVHKLNDKLLQ